MRHSAVRILPKLEFWLYHLLAKWSRKLFNLSTSHLHVNDTSELVIWLNKILRVPASTVHSVINWGSHGVAQLRSPFSRTCCGEHSWLTTSRCYTPGTSGVLPQVTLPWGCSQARTEHSRGPRTSPFLPNKGSL